jgi:hypothetical protein
VISLYTKRSKGRNCKTYRKSSENKKDNFTVKVSYLFNSEHSVIHSYLYNNVGYRYFLKINCQLNFCENNDGYIERKDNDVHFKLY